MYRLKQDIIVELPGGATITVAPITTPGLEAAKVATKRRRAALVADTKAIVALGIESEAECEDETFTQGLWRYFLTLEIGLRFIRSWTGILNPEGEETAELTPENIEALLGDPVIALRFFDTVIVEPVRLLAIKKNSVSAVPGTTETDQNSASPAAT